MSGPSPTECAEFYRLRDQRSAQYLDTPLVDLRPVLVHIAQDAARSGAGQLLLLALVNQLARVHRRIQVVVSDAATPLAVRTPIAGSDLGDCVRRTLYAINPCGEFAVTATPIEEPDARSPIRIGIGAVDEVGYNWYLGVDRAIAIVARRPTAVIDTMSSMRGAALAACLGAAAVLRTQLGRPFRERRVSAWNFAEDERADAGPDTLLPVDVGRVLMVGAGAVGAALAYWLHVFGVDAREWFVVEKDVVELHSTNRGLVFTPADTAWPMGPARGKAAIVANALGATAIPHWYHEWPDRPTASFDVVLALANDYGVRAQLAHVNAVVSLQATTSDQWQSQLHRHVLGRDDCIHCRTGHLSSPARDASALACASVILDEEPESRNDAALPFLSAGSGLMLAIALQRLMHGDLDASAHNRWAWDFESQHRFLVPPGACACADGCGFTLPPATRRKLNSQTRWASLDPATSTP